MTKFFVNIESNQYQRLYTLSTDKDHFFIDYGEIGEAHFSRLVFESSSDIDKYLSFIKGKGFSKPNWNECEEIKVYFSLEKDNDYSDSFDFENHVKKSIYGTGNGKISDRDCGLNKIIVWVEVFNVPKAVKSILEKFEMNGLKKRILKIEKIAHINNNLSVETLYMKD
ncbi:hypothetical protein [Aureispira sp. CCB-QB1]|uniref:hypothetical protein n=1 Tax=Aureispira sp. CCB-QB1 TaxID=1313421 RepID=UPI0006967FF4|nr:hypothetical protein [Aureispira sp. CCB-QB1]